MKRESYLREENVSIEEAPSHFMRRRFMDGDIGKIVMARICVCWLVSLKSFKDL